MEPTRVELLGDDGEWQELHGITNIVIFEEPEHVRAAVERARETQALMTATIRAYVEAMKPAMKAAAAAFAEISRTAQAAGLADEHGKPAKRTDRPAWQSPYGPAQRRKRP